MSELLNSNELAPGVPIYVRAPEISREAQAHARRGGRPYSDGHRRMYSAAIEILSGNLPKLDILEIGTGIGVGLEMMLKAGLVGRYFGFEPDIDALEMAQNVADSAGAQNVFLSGDDWLRVAQTSLIPACDFVFCIEVIEHVEARDVPQFLAEIHKRTKRALFLSTPDAATSTHGVATTAQWKRAIQSAGFDVATVARQWTTLYVCEPK